MIARLDAFLFDWYDGSAKALGSARILYAGLILVFHSFVDRLWIADVPDSLLTPPPGPLTLLPGVPPSWFLTGGAGLVVVLAALLLVGWRTTVVSILLSLTMIMLDGLTYSFGKIDHSMLIRLTPLLLGIAGWGNALSVDAHRRGEVRPIRGWAVATLGLIVAGAMFSAAWPKVVSGWLDPSTQAAEAHVARNVTEHGSAPLLTNVIAGLPWLLREALDWVTILAEAAPLVLLPWRRAFVWSLGALVLLHTGILLTLNIPFTGQLVVYFCMSGMAFAPRVQKVVEQALSSSILPAAAATAGFFLAVVNATWGRPFLRLVQAIDPRGLLYVHVSILVVTCVAVIVTTARRGHAAWQARVSP